MLPTIVDGEVLHVELAEPKGLTCGDIVLFQCKGEFKAHRIILARDGRFITRGDAAIEADA